MTTQQAASARKKTKRKLITGIVHCHKGIMNSVTIHNDMGGTEEIPVGKYRVRLLTSWYDDEIGVRCIGELIDLNDIATALEAGTTGYRPEDYRKYGEESYERTRKAAHYFDPGRVYFSEDDFIPDATAYGKAA